MYAKSTLIRIRTKYLSYPVPPKAKEVHFKILNDIYPCNDFIQNRFKMEVMSCSFCEVEAETAKHLFFECQTVNAFWKAFEEWIVGENNIIPEISYECLRVGFFMMEDKNVELVYNTLLLLATFFIHKCRFFKTNPVFRVFTNELNIYKKSVKIMKGAKAQLMYEHLCQLIEE